MEIIEKEGKNYNTEEKTNKLNDLTNIILVFLEDEVKENMYVFIYVF